MAGRGSFIESFPLFGYDLGDYDEPFAEKLHLLLKLRDNERVTRSSRNRPPLRDLGVYPRPVQNPLPIWIAVRGTPGSTRIGRGALLVGDPQEVVDKILYEHELFAHDRFLAQFTVGSIAHDKVMRSIELLGTKVAPAVRSALGRSDG